MLRSHQKMLNRKHHGQGNFMLKINRLKILKNANTASNFCFPCSERLFFLHINLWFTLGQLTWSDLYTQVSKMLIK